MIAISFVTSQLKLEKNTDSSSSFNNYSISVVPEIILDWSFLPGEVRTCP